MASITTKFGINDVFYTFDNVLGVIYKHTVKCVIINSTPYSDPDITYRVDGNKTISEVDSYSEDEVRELGNTWLTDKSISMFSDVGI